MSEYEKQMVLLSQCRVHAQSTEYQELEEGIAQNLQDDRCLHRAMWVMALLIALVFASLVCTAVLLDGYPQTLPPGVITAVGALVMAALISLLMFTALRAVCRRELNERLERCRRLVVKLLKTRLGNLGARPRPVVDQEAEPTVKPSEAGPPPIESMAASGRFAENQWSNRSLGGLGATANETP